MPERIDGGRAVAGIGALLLIISLFLDWFEPGITAWDAFEVLDLVLAFLALVVIVHGVPALARSVHAPEEPSGLFAGIGIAAFVIVAAALINQPPAAFGRGIDTGGWLGLAGAALMAVGGILSAARITVAVSFAPRTRDDRPRPTRSPEDPGHEAETRTLDN